MRYLTLLILKLLLEGPHTGYGIAKDIAARTGRKPSWGSIYPKLEQLTSCGILTWEHEGKSKVYTLTPKGRKYAKEELRKAEKLFADLIENTRALQDMTGEDLTLPINYLEAMKRGEHRFDPVNAELQRMRKELNRLYMNGLLDTRAVKINPAIRTLTNTLRSIT